MLCGTDTHGGNQQNGCGKPFSYSEAPSYVAGPTDHYDERIKEKTGMLQGPNSRFTVECVCCVVC